MFLTLVILGETSVKFSKPPEYLCWVLSLFGYHWINQKLNFEV